MELVYRDSRMRYFSYQDGKKIQKNSLSFQEYVGVAKVKQDWNLRKASHYSLRD